MASEGRFSPEIVDTLGRRAALTCSNPDCCAPTSGPTLETSGSVNVGEAAHIYGRTQTSARYNALLSSAELCDITNGIWVCRNCHKAIDRDASRYPAELLYQWRRIREADALDRMGKPGERLHEKFKSDRLKQFENISYLAQQISLDKPDYWEYKLTAEMLRTELSPIHSRWDQLKRGMYVRATKLITSDQAPDWLHAKVNEVGKLVQAMQPLIDEMHKSWGPQGLPGDDIAIVAVSRLFGGIAGGLLEWEENMRFAHFPDDFREIADTLQGVAGQQIEEIFRMPSELSRIFKKEEPAGYNYVQLIFQMPPNFEAKFEAAMQRLLSRLSGT